MGAVVQIGSAEESNPDIRQIIEVLPEQGHKWYDGMTEEAFRDNCARHSCCLLSYVIYANFLDAAAAAAWSCVRPWLMCRLEACLSSGLVLIFVNSKADSEDVALRLQKHFHDLHQHQHQQAGTGAEEVEVRCLHGGKQQTERSEILRRFKAGQCRVLVATDVASRGLDIKHIRTVINYDGATNRDSHIHRIGRTGRNSNPRAEQSRTALDCVYSCIPVAVSASVLSLTSVVCWPVVSCPD